MGQLTRENNVDLNKTIVYTYDNGGNLTSKKEYPYTTGTVGTATKTVTYGYDTAWKDKLTSYGGQTITYDAIGNPLTYRNNMSFTWQGRQMKTANLNGTSVSYKYNSDGLRSYKKVGSTVHEYEYLGDKLVYEKKDNLQFHYRYDAVGNLASLTRVNADGSINTAFAVCNSRGDVEELRQANGTIYARYVYDSWGRVLHVLDANGNEITSVYALAIQNPFRYRGYYYDSESGLYYVSSRYYDPTISRFISTDEYSVIVATPMSYTDKNMFAYCDSNPIMRTDISGAFWESAFDVLSLGASVVEVSINPTDVWAWAGLVGDVVDLVPFVTGIGEATKAINITRRAVNKTDNVIDTAKTIRKSANNASDIKKATSSYEILFSSGKNYIGKGSFNRAIKSSIEHTKPNKLNNFVGDSVTSIRWKSAPTSKAAFIDEFFMQKRSGGVLSADKNLFTYNQIWSPGKKYIKW